MANGFGLDKSEISVMYQCIWLLIGLGNCVGFECLNDRVVQLCWKGFLVVLTF